jgi:DNA-damage-inducible protein J
VRLFLHRVVSDQALPFELKVPNSKTFVAMNEGETIVKARRARFTNSSELFADIEKKAPQVNELFRPEPAITLRPF